MYFANFPQIYYPFKIGNKEEIKVVTDITINVRVVKTILDTITLYELYDIRNNESPEIVSERLYGTPEYFWILMILNDRYDYISDWPLPQPELDKYVTQLYGEGNEYAVKHYVNNGFIVNSDVVGAAAVTNQQYEESVNDAKRTIKVVSKEMMSNLAKQFEKLIA